MRNTTRSSIVIALSLLVIVAGAFDEQTAHAEYNAAHSGNERTKNEDVSNESMGVQDKTDEANQQSAKDQTAKESHQGADRPSHEQSSAATEKLSATKLQICSNRKEYIDSRIARIVERTDRQLSLFDDISTRAQKFYTVNGNTLENYDALIANVNAEQAYAKIAVAALANQKNEFNCNAISPKSTITEFKATLSHTIDALKDYRTSIKSLILGIKSVSSIDDTTQAGVQ